MSRKWLNQEREQLIIELFKKYDSAIKVADEIGKSTKVVYTTLSKYGIKRTGNRPKKQRKYKVSNCRTRFCPVVIAMLYEILGYDIKQIAAATGYSENGTRNVLTKRGLRKPSQKSVKQNFDLDQIEYEYVTLGMTTYELGEKYGVNHETIGGWMREERDIHFGKGGHQRTVKKSGHNESHRRLHEKALEEFKHNLKEFMHGQFEYVRDFRKDGKPFVVVRCVECGHVFRHYSKFQGVQWDCPECKRREIEANRQRCEQEKEARRYERMFEDIREYALDKTCKECGRTFHSSNKMMLYCSDKCRRKRRSFTTDNFRHYYHVKYGERYRDHYDPSITLKKLYERDGGVCQICGDPCDWDDMEWGCHGPTYPSLDHIVPRAKGGDHKWENVQLAHCICNSRKRDLIGDELREVVDIA